MYLVIVYYGPAGHGKGLVDAMSSFGVKAPLLKAVLTEDFKYRSAKDIHEYLTQLFADDVQKVHCYLPSEEIMAKRQNGAKPIKIAGCMKLHMICFNPNGSICTKVNICSCPECLKGDFQQECSIEKGKLIKGNFVDEDSDSADSDVEYEDEFHEELGEDFEAYELRSENILQLVVPGDIAALFSPMNSLELFYLCKILEVSVAEEDIHDKYHHCIPKGSSYFLVNYYEKKPNSEFNKNGFVIYKKIKYTAYVLPNQVMLPKVNVTNIGLDIHVAMGEYQWICDCIGTFESFANINWVYFSIIKGTLCSKLT